MDLINKFDIKSFKEGVISGKGIAIAFFPFGFALGLISNSYGINGIITSMMSFLIYSGASETLLMDIFSKSNFDILSSVFAAAMLNFRYVLISIPMYKALNHYDRVSKCLVGLIYTDETIAYLAIRKNKDMSFALGVNVIGYLSFGISTIIGVLIGAFVPAIIINSMKFALYGTFLSLMISSLMIEFKNIIIILITLILKLVLIFIPPFNGISESLKIVLILILTSLIYASISMRGDKE
ncbi:AzlC family ABC transporter permease [Pseudostreptobacillus hongkongensis]|uniref:AzlC family ABC transporter permease n=1 Tax=Pseudostreptobacillus hongkongensis TaxID=1162717 RepID=UPI0028D2B1E4|nr:AzlC family ABC transporter permease [Pseudostreptobacillus hongkongensis]